MGPGEASSAAGSGSRCRSRSRPACSRSSRRACCRSCRATSATSAASTSGAERTRGRMVLGASLFIAGFSLVFLAVVHPGGHGGRFFLEYAGPADPDRRRGHHPARPGLHRPGHLPAAHDQAHLAPAHGLLGAPLLGIMFAIGWTPCIGPTLVAVGFLASDGGDPGRALLDRHRYCLGLGIPFVLVALGFGWVGSSVAWVKRHIRVHQHRRRRAAHRDRPAHGQRAWGARHVEPRGGDRWLPHRPLTLSRATRMRPSDHIESEAPADPAIAQPKLGPVGYAAVLLAPADQHAHGARAAAAARARRRSRVARAADAPPTRTASSSTSSENPELFRVLDALGVFSTFSSPVVLGHLPAAVRLARRLHRPAHQAPLRRAARPPAEDPRAPAAAGRLRRADEDGGGCRGRHRRGRAAPAAAGLSHRAVWRTRSPPSAATCARPATWCSTRALVGMLVTVGIGGGFGYTGQRVIVQGDPFTNVLSGYDSYQPGPLLQRGSARAVLAAPRRVRRASTSSTRPPACGTRLDLRGATSACASPAATGPRRRSRSTRRSQSAAPRSTCSATATRPVITVRDADGVAVFSRRRPVPPARREPEEPWRRQGAGRAQPSSSGCMGFFYPDPLALDDGTYASLLAVLGHGESLLTLFVYAGDLGLDTGVGVNAYSARHRRARRSSPDGDADLPALELTQGETVDLPDGLGTIEFDGPPRFISVDIHHDPTPGWVLLFAAAHPRRPPGEPVHPAPPDVGEGGRGRRRGPGSSTRVWPAARIPRSRRRSPSSRDRHQAAPPSAGRRRRT